LFFAASLPDWVRQAQTFGIFAAGYLVRLIGGIVMAHFGNIRDRKRMFMLSVLLMAIPTLLIGLLPTYRSIGVVAPVLLLAMRVMQGAGDRWRGARRLGLVAEHACPWKSWLCPRPVYQRPEFLHTPRFIDGDLSQSNIQPCGDSCWGLEDSVSDWRRFLDSSQGGCAAG
jgi:hypothetical protein